MWQYIRMYAHYALLAALFMGGEVLMDLVQPGLMSRIVDDGVLGLHNNGVGNLELVWKVGAQMIGMALIGCCFGSLSNVFVNMASQNMGNELRKNTFRKIMTFSFPQIDSFGAGSLITRITNDVTQVERLVSQIVRGMVRTVLMTAGSMYFMFRLSPDFAFIVLCALPFIIGTMYFCLRRINPLFAALQEKLDGVNDILQEDISAIRIIKACVRETYEKMRFGKANDDLIRTQLKVLLTLAFMSPVVNMLMNLTIAAILWFGAQSVMAGKVSPGSIMAAITYTTQLLMGIMMLLMLFQNISRGFISWNRLSAVLHLEPEIRDGLFKDDAASATGTAAENTAVNSVAEETGATNGNGAAAVTTAAPHTQNRIAKGKIEFRNVFFAYPGSDKNVLEHINLTIEPGETIAIMGATGSGKTTLINLIPRFYDVTEGSVQIDGVDVRDYKLSSLRDKVAVALQKSELFSESVTENIAWGNRNATQDMIREAAVTAQADEFIVPLEHGYDTVVAERGMSLSGGQKQRVALSRAVLKKAAIMIFDDATSALDLKTEADFYNELARTSPASTKIIVAQRVASVRRASRILILDNGCIVAEGTHQELLQSCKIYQDIYRSQIGDIASAENATPMPGSASTDAALPTAAGGRAVTADA